MLKIIVLLLITGILGKFLVKMSFLWGLMSYLGM